MISCILAGSAVSFILHCWHYDRVTRHVSRDLLAGAVRQPLFLAILSGSIHVSVCLQNYLPDLAGKRLGWFQWNLAGRTILGSSNALEKICHPQITLLLSNSHKPPKWYWKAKAKTRRAFTGRGWNFVCNCQGAIPPFWAEPRTGVRITCFCCFLTSGSSWLRLARVSPWQLWAIFFIKNAFARAKREKNYGIAAVSFSKRK